MPRRMARIGELLDGHVRLHALLPAGARLTVEQVGEHRNSRNRDREGAAIPSLDTDETQAIVRAIDLPRIVVERVDYATVRALRLAGDRPRVLSAGAVALDPAGRRVLLHRRSSSTENYPGRLHTLGGAFAMDDVTVENAMRREVAEESGARVVDGDWPILVSEEPPTGYAQVVFLGVALAGVRPFASGEGELFPAEIGDLAALLCDRAAWVPSGLAHVLAWLVAGAPGIAVDAGALVDHALADGHGEFPSPRGR